MKVDWHGKLSKSEIMASPAKLIKQYETPIVLSKMMIIKIQIMMMEHDVGKVLMRWCSTIKRNVWKDNDKGDHVIKWLAC